MTSKFNSGYVVRDEEVLPGGGDLVYSSRREGERVSAGGTVAQIYQSAQALQWRRGPPWGR